MENNNKAFAYRVPIGDYNYLQCSLEGFSTHYAENEVIYYSVYKKFGTAHFVHM